MLLDKDAILRLSEHIDRVAKTHMDFMIESLPNFEPHVIIFNENGDGMGFSLMSTDIGQMPEAASDIIEQSGAVATILVTPSWVPELDEDDPYMQDLIDGTLDLKSIPSDKKKSAIVVYTEVVGAKRKAYIIPLTKDRTKSEGVSTINVKTIDLFPGEEETWLISMNEFVN